MKRKSSIINHDKELQFKTLAQIITKIVIKLKSTILNGLRELFMCNISMHINRYVNAFHGFFALKATQPLGFLKFQIKELNEQLQN